MGFLSFIKPFLSLVFNVALLTIQFLQRVNWITHHFACYIDYIILVAHDEDFLLNSRQKLEK